MGILLCAGGASGAEAEVIVSPLPEGVPVYQGVTASVNGRDLPLVKTAVNHNRTWTSRPILSEAAAGVFAMEGSAEIVLDYGEEKPQTVTVRPLSLGITPQIRGATVRFALHAPTQVTVEIDGRQESAVHLFAQPVWKNAPDPADPSVLYFGPGLWNTGEIELQNGQTVYLADGAFIRGRFVANGKRNLSIIGNGLLDGSAFDRWEDCVVPIEMNECENVRIEGITILDPAAWTVNLYKCRGVEVERVNILAARSNSDGITVQSCRNVRVQNCFVRGWDDNLVVKGYDGDATDIRFTNCVLWTDLAQSCEIGYETRAEKISGIRFENITVLHANHKPVISIHNSDSAWVTDVRFENITVEDCRIGQGDGSEYLIDLTTTKSQWSKSKTRGNIRDVIIRDIKVLQAERMPAVRIFAFSKDATIDDVSISGLSLMGEEIHSFASLRYTDNRKLGQNITLSWE